MAHHRNSGAHGRDSDAVDDTSRQTAPEGDGHEHGHTGGQSVDEDGWAPDHGPRHRTPDRQTGWAPDSGRSGGTRTESADGEAHALLRGIAAVFALFGTLSVWGSAEMLLLSGSVPVAGSGLRLVAVVGLVVGLAYLYAAYGVWRVRLRGWRVGMWLVVSGGVLSFLVLLEGAGATGLLGLLISGALGWGLHTNREPFRDRPGASGQTPPTSGEGNVRQLTDNPHAATDDTSGYASKRRGRH